MGLNQWLASLPAGKRHIYFLLLGIILITIPCYCLGIAALAGAPPVQVPTPTPFREAPGPTMTLPSLSVPSPEPTETIMPTTFLIWQRIDDDQRRVKGKVSQVF